MSLREQELIGFRSRLKSSAAVPRVKACYLAVRGFWVRYPMPGSLHVLQLLPTVEMAGNEEVR